MTDRDALLAAILDNPADDLVRLAYADWLQDHDDRVPCPGCGGEGTTYTGPGGGQRSMETCPTCKGERSVPAGNAARAEFIRVQVELAKHEAIRAASGKSGWRTLKLRTQVEALRARESALLAAHGRAWEKPICDVLGLGYATHDDNGDSTAFGGWRGMGDYEWLWQRGFIGSVRLPTSAELVGDRACPRCRGTGSREYGGWDGPGEPLTQDAGPCPSCGGLGRVRACPRVGDVAPGGGDVCGLCAGSGTLPALAPRLARVPGITTVEVGDRVPDAIGDEFCWLRDRQGVVDSQATLPDPIFDRLEGGRKEYAGIEWRDEDGVEDVWVVYPSLALATAALARAGGGLLAGLRLPHPEQSA